MSDPDVLIKVDGVGKKFCRDLKRSLWYGVKDLAAEVTGRPGERDNLRKDEFWAVDDVSFEVRRGECLGLIGHNGAGKSTLLKMLNGLIKPDRGSITMRGRIGALIELGAGFNPILTGRENVYVNGSVLGMTKTEIDRKFDAILDFAEIGDFIDAPVQTYSSGMKVRLGFAVAAQLEPDILLIDEVLAVGDVGFRLKCYNAISELLADSALIFVSHLMPQVSRLCDLGLVMERGKAHTFTSEINTAIESYNQLVVTPTSATKSSGAGRIETFTVNGDDQPIVNTGYGDPLAVTCNLELPASTHEVRCRLTILDASMQPVWQAGFANRGALVPVVDGRASASLTVPALHLNPGRYHLTLHVLDGATDEILVWSQACRAIDIQAEFLGNAVCQVPEGWQTLAQPA